MKAAFTLLAAGLLGLSRVSQAQTYTTGCATAALTAAACTRPAGATLITNNASVTSGTYYYDGSSGSISFSVGGSATVYYTTNVNSNVTLGGGMLVYNYAGSGTLTNFNQDGGVLQVCSGSTLSLSGNINGGSFQVLGAITFPNAFSLQNTSQFIIASTGTANFSSSLAIAGGTGSFVNNGVLNALNGATLNGPGLVNNGIINFGNLIVNGSGALCMRPGAQVNVTTFQTNDAADSFTVRPNNAGTACVKITNYGNFNANLATTSPSQLVVCKSNTVTPGSAEYLKYGTATVVSNCSACPATPLPVVLVGFEANTPTGPTSGVQVRWRTASEVGHQGFVVARSADGRAWADRSPLLPGTGGSLRGAAYTWTDSSPLAGTSYYRLRMLAQDGTVDYSPIVAVEVPPAEAWAWVSAPEADHLSLNWVPAGPGTCSWQLLDVQGRIVGRQQVVATTGTATVDLRNLNPGGYWLWVQQGPQRQLLRFVRP